jgi:hypothetical protein
VVFVGPRHRGWAKNASVDNSSTIDSVLAPRKEYYGNDLNVISISCDVGFGKDLKAYCEERGIKFLEFVVYFNGPRSKPEYAAAYNARHASLLEIGEEFHVITSRNRQSNVEDIIDRLRLTKKPYAIYNEETEVIESSGWEQEEQTPVQADQNPTDANCPESRSEGWPPQLSTL